MTTLNLTINGRAHGPTEVRDELTMNASCLSNGSCPNAIAAGVKLPYPGFSGGINQALRPFPQYGSFNQEDNSFTPDRTGNSTYHSMRMSVNKRFAEGLSFLVSYTISKNITDADSEGPGVSGFIGTNSFIGQNSYNRRAEKAGVAHHAERDGPGPQYPGDHRRSNAEDDEIRLHGNWCEKALYGGWCGLELRGQRPSFAGSAL